MLGARLRPVRDGGSEPHRRLYYSGQPRTPLRRNENQAILFLQVLQMPGGTSRSYKKGQQRLPAPYGRDTFRRPGVTGSRCWSFAFQGHEQYSDTVYCEPAPYPGVCPNQTGSKRPSPPNANPRDAEERRGRSQAWAFVYPGYTRWGFPASSVAGRDADGLRTIAAAPGITGKDLPKLGHSLVTVKPRYAREMKEQGPSTLGDAR